MSAEILRRAASGLRDEWSDGNDPMGTAWHRERDFHLAAADWLDVIADRADSLAETIGSAAVAKSVVRSQVLGYTQALAVARAYLGESS